MTMEKEIQLSPKMVKLLEHIYDKGFVTKDTRPFFTALRFYNYLWLAKDYHLIECDGNNERHQKIWKLNERGKRIVEYYKKIKEELKDEG